MLGFMALTAPAIAMLIIDVDHECALETEGGQSQYVAFGLTTWMYIASVFHLFVVCVLFALDPDGLFGRCFSEALNDYWIFERVVFCFICVNIIILFAFYVIGWILQEEVWHHGVNNEQCSQVLLGWLIFGILVLGAICCACCAFLLCVFSGDIDLDILFDRR